MSIHKSIIAGLIGLGFSAAAFAVPTVTIGGTPVAGEGEKTSQSGIIVTLDFNGAGAYVPPVGTHFAPAGANSLQTGSSPAQYAAPPGDTSRYLCMGPFCGSPTTIGVDGVNILEANYIGFYAGSLDTFNTITFLDHGIQVAQYTGAFLASLANIPANGDQTKGFYYNVFPDASTKFTDVILASSDNAFEIDNFAIGKADPPAKIPLPGTLALLGLGFLGVGSLKKRQKAC